MINHNDKKIKKILLKWENSDFRREANENWTKTKNRVAEANKKNVSKLDVVFSFLLLPSSIVGIVTFFTSLILYDQKYEGAVNFFGVGIFCLLLAYICYSRIRLNRPKKLINEEKNRVILKGASDRMMNNKEDFIKIEIGELTINDYQKKYLYEPSYNKIENYSWFEFDIKHFGKCLMIGMLVPPLGLYMIFSMQKELGLFGNLAFFLAWSLYFLGIIQPGDACYYPSGIRTGHC